MVAIASLPKENSDFENASDERFVGVNAAFLQEIKDSSPDVASQRSRLVETCQETQSNQARLAAFVDQLNDLRDQLAVYFSLEETYGYIVCHASVPPRQSGDRARNGLSREAVGTQSDRQWAEIANEIRNQHGQLYLQLTDLIEEAEELQYRGLPQGSLRGLARRVSVFLEQFDAHERAEAGLIGESRHPKPDRS